MGYMHVVSLSDQAQERVGNSPECNGAVSSQLHYAFVKMFVENALEILRSSPEGMAAEEWRKLVRNMSLTLVSNTTQRCSSC